VNEVDVIFDSSLIEADGKVGGMAAHFDFSGTSIERFYPFYPSAFNQSLRRGRGFLGESGNRISTLPKDVGELLVR